MVRRCLPFHPSFNQRDVQRLEKVVLSNLKPKDNFAFFQVYLNEIDGCRQFGFSASSCFHIKYNLWVWLPDWRRRIIPIEA